MTLKVGKQIAPIQEFIARIRAAAAARAAIPGSDIVLIARTDAAQTYGMDESINRLREAIKAGADVAFLEGVPSYEFNRTLNRTNRPICQASGPKRMLKGLFASYIQPQWVIFSLLIIL